MKNGKALETARELGALAAAQRKPRTACPYRADTSLHGAWMRAWERTPPPANSWLAEQANSTVAETNARAAAAEGSRNLLKALLLHAVTTHEPIYSLSVSQARARAINMGFLTA